MKALNLKKIEKNITQSKNSDTTLGRLFCGEGDEGWGLYAPN
jgi:hypothetical protein